MTEKNDSINIIKALGIILMVLGHSGAPFHNFIYLFHMSIFFMCSGYCWSEKHAISIHSLTQYVRNKIWSLYIPFVAFNLSCCVLSGVFSHLHLYEPKIYKLTLRGIISVLSFRGGGGQFCAATWFLCTLFFISVEYCMVRLLSNSFPKGKIVSGGGNYCCGCLIRDNNSV